MKESGRSSEQKKKSKGQEAKGLVDDEDTKEAEDRVREM